MTREEFTAALVESVDGEKAEKILSDFNAYADKMEEDHDKIVKLLWRIMVR
jgi:hypothetical protein